MDFMGQKIEEIVEQVDDALSCYKKYASNVGIK